MSRGKRVTLETTVERDGIEIDIEVTGVATAFRPGTYEDPPEGGEVEDVEATYRLAGHKVDFPLTDEEVEQFADELYMKLSEMDE